MNILPSCTRPLVYRIFLLFLLAISLTATANTERLYIHFIGDSITKGMLNNSYLNGGKISEYGGYRGELFQYLMEMAKRPQKADWPKIIEDHANKQLYVIGENGIKYELISLGANKTPTDVNGPYQISCNDKDYLICQKPELYAYNDGRSGETSEQVLTALAKGEWPLLDFYRNYKIEPDSELLTVILLGTNDLLQHKDANTANNIKAIVNASIEKLQGKITRFAFVINTIPNAQVYSEKGYNIENLNEKISHIINKLKEDYEEDTKVKFFTVNQAKVETLKNDPDFAHPGQEGWGSVHPSYYQYRIMACNLLFANTFSGTKIVNSRYDKITQTEIPLTASKHTPFPLTTLANQGCVIPADPQGLFGALNFLTGGKVPPIKDRIRWHNPDIAIDKINNESTVTGHFNPAEVLPADKKLKPIYQCAINVNDVTHFKNCNTQTLPNGKVGFALHDLNPEIDKTIFITAIHPHYSNIHSQTYHKLIPWPEKPQLTWNNADLKVDDYDSNKKQARVSFNPACIKLDTKQQCNTDKVQYRWWITGGNKHTLNSVDKRTTIIVPLIKVEEFFNLEAYNDDHHLHDKKSILIKETTPSKVVLQCPSNLQQMSKLVAKGDIDTYPSQYLLLKVSTPEKCNFSANKTSCILPDPNWPKLLCYNAATQEAYQAAGRLTPDAINKEHPDCIATEQGTFSGSNCHLSW